MFMSIRRYKTAPGAAKEIGRRVSEGFVPIVSKAPGFIAYYAVDGGNDVIASISIFKDKAGVDESTRMAAGWVKENAALFASPPEITAGEVLAHKTA